MKLRYVQFYGSRGDRLAYPRAHLRWLELIDGSLKCGFSSESVILRGQHMDLLMRDIVIGKTEEIQARPSRHAQSGTWSVEDISVQQHAESSSKTTGKSKGKA